MSSGPGRSMSSGLAEALRDLRVADPDLGLKPLLDKLREQQLDLGAGAKEVCEALTALEAESEAREAGAALHAAELQETAVTLGLSPREATDLSSELQQQSTDEIEHQWSAAAVCSRSSTGPQPQPQSTDEIEHHGTFSVLGDDMLGIIFGWLCNVLEPRVAVYFSSVCQRLRKPTHALLQQLRTDHEVAVVLCHKLGLQSCKALREAKGAKIHLANWQDYGHSAAALGLLGTLGSELPALERLILHGSSGSACPDGAQRLAEGLGAGALPAVAWLTIVDTHVNDADVSSLAAALGRGALPRLKHLWLTDADITDAGLVALAPALRRRQALESLSLMGSPLGDEGLAALVAPPPLAGALSPPAGGLKKLKKLYLSYTKVTDAGCATLAFALDSGALPALNHLNLYEIPASAAAKATVNEARAGVIVVAVN